jgi:cyclopropane fatty-acyl-phospholipid synthase-like methyltransferase
MSSQPQVPPSHYAPGEYDDFKRWSSYWHQIQTIRRCRPKRVLEIGVGSGVLTWYMRERLKLDVTTVDIDPALRPDVLSDVLELRSRLAPASYDLVCAFQVLEHLPFDRLDAALAALAAVTRDRVVVTLPNNGRTFQMRMEVWRFQLALGRKVGWRRHWRFDGEHYWEVGTVGHSAREVRRHISEALILESETVYPDNPYHREYVGRRRQASA